MLAGVLAASACVPTRGVPFTKTYKAYPGAYGAANLWLWDAGGTESLKGSTLTSVPVSVPASQAANAVAARYFRWDRAQRYEFPESKSLTGPFHVDFMAQLYGVGSDRGSGLWDRLQPTGVYIVYASSGTFWSAFMLTRDPKVGIWRYALDDRTLKPQLQVVPGRPYVRALQNASREASSFEARMVWPDDAKGHPQDVWTQWMVFRFADGNEKAAPLGLTTGMGPTETLIDGKPLVLGQLYPSDYVLKPFTIVVR